MRIFPPRPHGPAWCRRPAFSLQPVTDIPPVTSRRQVAVAKALTEPAVTWHQFLEGDLP